MSSDNDNSLRVAYPAVGNAAADATSVSVDTDPVETGYAKSIPVKAGHAALVPAAIAPTAAPASPSTLTPTVTGPASTEPTTTTSADAEPATAATAATEKSLLHRSLLDMLQMLPGLPGNLPANQRVLRGETGPAPAPRGRRSASSGQNTDPINPATATTASASQTRVRPRSFDDTFGAPYGTEGSVRANEGPAPTLANTLGRDAAAQVTALLTDRTFADAGGRTPAAAPALATSAPETARAPASAPPIVHRAAAETLPPAPPSVASTHSLAGPPAIWPGYALARPRPDTPARPPGASRHCTCSPYNFAARCRSPASPCPAGGRCHRPAEQKAPLPEVPFFEGLSDVDAWITLYQNANLERRHSHKLEEFLASRAKPWFQRIAPGKEKLTARSVITLREHFGTQPILDVDLTEKERAYNKMKQERSVFSYALAFREVAKAFGQDIEANDTRQWFYFGLKKEVREPLRGREVYKLDFEAIVTEAMRIEMIQTPPGKRTGIYGEICEIEEQTRKLQDIPARLKGQG